MGWLFQIVGPQNVVAAQAIENFLINFDAVMVNNARQFQNQSV